tara:strand:- start:107 stop:283 length:177 start_codon:yes stop_codon:yes gene_type:complete
MQALREFLGENTLKVGRLVPRMPDHGNVSVDQSIQHIIVGSANNEDTVKAIENPAVGA